jgi:hypothetical protein
MSGVSIATTKRLFAVSGNCCAFPKCPHTLIHDGKPTGRICHIRGKRPGSARYDPSMTDIERNAFDNLILMCPIHHDVVDDDEASYTVERLTQIKADHEKKHANGKEQLMDAQAVSLIDFSNTSISGSVLNNVVHNVVSHNQSGGIIAHTVNIGEPKVRPALGREQEDKICDSIDPKKMVSVWFMLGSENAEIIANDIFQLLKARGQPMFGDHAVPNIYLSPLDGILLKPKEFTQEIHVGRLKFADEE